MSNRGRVEELAVRDFRCFAEARIHPAPGCNLITGANARGKTTLLEAVCVALRLSSPRVTRLAHAIRHGAESATSRVVVDGHALSLQIPHSGRVMEIDGMVCKDPVEFTSFARVVWFGNPDLQLAVGPSDLRRRYIDFIGTQAEPAPYRRALAAYERALRSRNLLLKNPHRGGSRALEAFNAPFLAAGEELWRLRRAIVNALAPHFLAAHTKLAPAPASEQGEISHENSAFGNLEEALASSAAEEARLRHTVVGPHRDDLRITLGGRPAARHASEGQQRSIAVALKLAQAELLTPVGGPPPLFLIDDVFGELDASRRSLFLNLLAEKQAQALITTTEPEWLGNFQPDRRFHVGPQGIERLE